MDVDIGIELLLFLSSSEAWQNERYGVAEGGVQSRTDRARFRHQHRAFPGGFRASA